ncbi:hypothetical protein [Pseudovibrio sp. Ad37]|uniref:hypothetical protein n=1 Tax=Pseudovibrio sp. Ad37 TaxID=989422 RepID=UPI0007AEDD67|nr:hypothetical protein [Pseudovibrio sp. Ad37]KZL24234.1 hypothetical protein PsAD37_02805 [Pseudovibrio sp. Ad37]
MTKPDHHNWQTSEREFLDQMIRQLADMDDQDQARFEHPSIPIALKASSEGDWISISLVLSTDEETPAWIGEFARFAEEGEKVPNLVRRLRKSRVKSNKAHTKIANEIQTTMLEPVKPLSIRSVIAIGHLKQKRKEIAETVQALGIIVPDDLTTRLLDASFCLDASPYFGQENASLSIDTQRGSGTLVINDIPTKHLPKIVSYLCGKHIQSLSHE